MDTPTNLFEKQQYINLETYRQTGQAVRTPVWFAQDGGSLYIWTGAASGKVKRIRRNPRVMLAPSDYAGKPKGAFVPGCAQVVEAGHPLYQRGEQLINKKYGLLKTLFAFLGRKEQHVVIEVQLDA